MPYTLIFFSSSQIALPVFEVLAKDARFKILGLFSQPKRASGRGLEEKESAIKQKALKLGIPVFQPEKLAQDMPLLGRFKKDRPDLLLSFAYGQWISEAWLTLPKIAALNVHPSLLPKYRGPSPLQAAIWNGDSETGISLMKMVKEMDAGPIAAQIKLPLTKHTTTNLLAEEVASKTAEWLPDCLVNVAEQGDAIFKAQDETQVSFCQKIEKKDGELNFKKSAEELHRQFRATISWPGVYTFFEGQRLKIVDMEIGSEALEPGRVKCEKHCILIGTADGSLQVKQLQLEGKKSLHADQFILGQKNFCSTFLPS